MDLRIYSDAEDRLPRSRAATLAAIFDASGIDDHDCARADAAYAAWKRNGKRGKKPKASFGGILDAMDPDGNAPGSLLEAFEIATKGAKTWADIAPVLSMLRDVPGLERARLPDDVMLRHALMGAAMRCDARAESTPDGDEDDDDGDTSFNFGANVVPKRMSKAELVAITPGVQVRAYGQGWSAVYRRRELGGWSDEKTGEIVPSGILAEMASVGFSFAIEEPAPDSVEKTVRKGARRAGVFEVRDGFRAGQCRGNESRRRRART